MFLPTTPSHLRNGASLPSTPAYRFNSTFSEKASPTNSTSPTFPTDLSSSTSGWKIPTLVDLAVKEVFLKRLGNDLLSSGDQLQHFIPQEVAAVAFARLCATMTLQPHIMRYFSLLYEDNFFTSIEITDSSLSNQAMGFIGATKSLKHLIITNCSGFDDSGVQQLKELTNLEELDMSRCINISDLGFRKLSTLQKLNKLNLDNTNLGDDGVGFIVGLNKLISLSLSNTKLTDIGIQVLTRGLIIPNNKQLACLKTFHLRGTRITDQVIEFVARLKNIRFIDFKGTEVTVFGMDKLKRIIERKPNVLSTKVVVQTIAIVEKQQSVESVSSPPPAAFDSFQKNHISSLITFLKASNRKRRSPINTPSFPNAHGTNLSNNNSEFGSRIGDFVDDNIRVSNTPSQHRQQNSFSFSTPTAPPQAQSFLSKSTPRLRTTPLAAQSDLSIFDFSTSPIKSAPPMRRQSKQTTTSLLRSSQTLKALQKQGSNEQNMESIDPIKQTFTATKRSFATEVKQQQESPKRQKSSIAILEQQKPKLQPQSQEALQPPPPIAASPKITYSSPPQSPLLRAVLRSPRNCTMAISPSPSAPPVCLISTMLINGSNSNAPASPRPKASPTSLQKKTSPKSGYTSLLPLFHSPVAPGSSPSAYSRVPLSPHTPSLNTKSPTDRSPTMVSPARRTRARKKGREANQHQHLLQRSHQSQLLIQSPMKQTSPNQIMLKIKVKSGDSPSQADPSPRKRKEPGSDSRYILIPCNSSH